MTRTSKERRYQRIREQLGQLLTRTTDPDARMATIAALLHYKFDYFFWTGFYFLKEGDLLVKTYQGPLACQILEKNTGVCWAGINRKQTIVVPDVHQFPGHIACDSRSNSEIVVPVRDRDGIIRGVLDIDSTAYNSFDEVDAENLEIIVRMIYTNP
ncbi:MAG: GAF domain-containing protein [Bacteroidetes bacterium]|nr:MAG: GAF domain-containing protein [Bacteroidota bacterium]